MRAMSTIAFAAALISCGVTRAEDFPGDPTAGRVLAEQVCAVCHSLDGAGGTGGPARAERSLKEIAKDPRMTPTALIFWLTGTPHPTMPSLILSSEEARDVTAFILTLNEAGGK